MYRIRVETLEKRAKSDEKPTKDRASLQAHTNARCNAARLFTRIPFTIDPLWARPGVVRSPFPSLLGLFIRLPVAAALFKAHPNPSPLFLLFLSIHRSLFSPFAAFVYLSLLAVCLARHGFRPCLSRRSRDSMPDNKGDCMYYLGCLLHACPGSSQSTFESRHDRYKAPGARNAMRSNRTPLWPTLSSSHRRSASCSRRRVLSRGLKSAATYGAQTSVHRKRPGYARYVHVYRAHGYRSHRRNLALPPVSPFRCAYVSRLVAAPKVPTWCTRFRGKFDGARHRELSVASAAVNENDGCLAGSSAMLGMLRLIEN